MEIRRARAGESAAIDALQRRSSWVWEEDRAALDAHPDALGIPPDAIAEGRVRVAVGARGELLGLSVVTDGATGVCELDGLFVEPDRFRRGVGRALVEDAARRAAAGGGRWLDVVAHPRTCAFYERVGFVRGEPAQTRFGPAVRLRRKLAA